MGLLQMGMVEEILFFVKQMGDQRFNDDQSTINFMTVQEQEEDYSLWISTAVRMITAGKEWELTLF